MTIQLVDIRPDFIYVMEIHPRFKKFSTKSENAS